ncbi:hypothetical protein B296_00018479 [Ensete ventricosum]|uniref:Aspergillus nuclease S1 n=1 Tax=Ensete ventricosum TaxID=4639 RepID=A0A426Z2I8_ENSVE|nr:hypothetical protein B296_00018479 [Ensete ventricosum]
MLYVPIWFVPDEVVRRVCAALVAGRAYLRKIGHTCARSVISMQGPSYSCQVGDLAAVCSWADEVRFRYRWSSPLHYANTPGVCNFEYSRDCHNSKGVQDMCVVGAINNYTTQLLSYGDASSGCKNSLPHSADDYFFSRLPVVEKRIAQAGVRLASLLNRVFRRTEEEEVLQLVVQSVDEAHAI